MRKFASATLAILLLNCLSFAQTKIHEVKSGDTIGAIAVKYGVSQSDVIKANALSNAHKLKLGQKLRIPKPTAKPVASKPQTSGGYVVRNGDNDWSIAARFGVSSKQIRVMNPGVNWERLKIGQRLNVPGKTVAKSSVKPAASLASHVKPTAAANPAAKSLAYAVRKDDNDWIIAKRFNTTPSKLHAANPNVKWNRLQIGQYIRIPGVSATSTKTASSSKSIGRYAVIAKDNVVVRRQASTSSSKVTTVSAGTQVKVVSKSGDWYKLQFPKGTVAWVRGDMLKPSTSRPTSTLASVRKPSSSSSRTASKSSSSSKRYAYAGTGSGSKALDTAMGMIGTRYSYGRSSRSSTDCSGMVLQAYKAQGVSLPRTSREMSRVGQSVSKSDLKPGDLVFFKTRGSRGVSHVGIYKGGGQFVHASSGAGHVTVSSMNDGYYSRRYAGAKRVVKAPTVAAKKETTSNVKVAANAEPKKEEPKKAAAPTEIVP